jgi:Fungal Zn(2)-Cys(6) binuclear cluster domain
MVRKPRGSYAGLICLRCRARKIKCVLPDGVQPSNVPQSDAHSCQRCRQNGFECVVDSTTLGRPSRRVEREANAEEFLLAQPWEVYVFPRS